MPEKDIRVFETDQLAPADTGKGETLDPVRDSITELDSATSTGYKQTITSQDRDAEATGVIDTSGDGGPDNQSQRVRPEEL